MTTKKSKNIFKVFGAWLKERVRKFLVALKKNPQAIPLASLCVAFLHYSLNLTDISNTTAKIQVKIMGLAAFITMLFMILSFVCMLSAFPKRQKPKIPMIVVMVVLYGAVIAADVHYLNSINYALSTASDSIDKASLSFILTAQQTVVINIVLIAITLLLVLIEPLLAKLLKKIKTSINVEGSGDIGAIDIADEE